MSATPTLEQVLAALRRQGKRVQKAGSGWLGFCPVHGDGDRPSLSLTERDGKLLLNCHARHCAYAEILGSLGFEASSNGIDSGRMSRREIAAYDYRNERGELLSQNVRFEPKDFRQRRPDGGGGWIWNMDGVRRVPYRLPELAEQPRVFVAEGEKDCDALWALGLAATTNAAGAGKWTEEHTAALVGVAIPEVIVLPDNDEPGERHASAVATSCQSAGLRVSIVRLPGLPPKGDVSNWLDAGHTREELLEAAASAADFSAEAPPTLAIAAGLGIGLGQFLARDFPPAEPLIEGVLSSDGGGWIGGEEKLGKTYYSIEEALCLALAQPICNRFVVPARRSVLFLEEEDPPRRFHTRACALLRGHGFDPDDPALRADLDQWFRLAVWEGVKLDDLAMVARLQTTIEEFQPAVVYVDVLRKVTRKNLNHSDEASALLEVLDDLRRRSGVIFRVVHHFRKVQGFRAGRGSQEIGGSYVLGAWGENSLFFEPIGRKQGAVRVEVQSKDSAPVPGFRLVFETEGPRHAPTLMRLKAEEERAADDIDDLIFQAIATLPKMDALAGKPGVPVKALAAAVKRSDKTVRRALKSLEDAGRVIVSGQAAKGKDLYAVTQS